MSLVDLTRNSFQSGLSARKWANLCKLAIAKNRAVLGFADIETTLSNSILILYRSYPGHPTLREYLKFALQDEILSLAVFLATFLQAARSPELQNATTLHNLCQIVLDTRSASQMSFASLARSSESSVVLQDALFLLRIAHSLSMPSPNPLTTSASELVVRLLSSVTDLSQISTAQAMVLFADVTDLLQTPQLPAEVRQLLDTFILSLSLLIGDDAKIAKEAQMMQTMQIATGKVDLLDSNSDTDIVTCALLLNHLVSAPASEFGAGNNVNAVAMLIATWRWTLWTPTVFYLQLMLSAFTSLTQRSPSAGTNRHINLCRAFLISRLPRLLSMFEKSVRTETATEADLRTAMQKALATVSRRTDLLATYDRVTADTQEQSDVPLSVYREFAQQLYAHGLIEQAFAATLIPSISVDKSPLMIEAQENGHDLMSYLDAKVTPENSVEDVCALLDRIWRDPVSHASFAETAMQRFECLTRAFDVESLSHLCKILCNHEEGLDIIALHVKMSDLLFHALAFLEDYDCNTVGDPQAAVTYLGDVVLFIQSALTKFKLSGSSFSLADRTVVADLMDTPATVFSPQSLTSEDNGALSSWFTALFDSSSEGIEDTILRSTKPKTLLRICATLFSQAILACAEHKIDAEVLNNGVSYFTGPLLNWTLVGVVKALLQEIELRGLAAPVHLEILQTLILSPSCPSPVLRLCSPGILRLLRLLQLLRHVQNVKGRKLHIDGKIDFPRLQDLALRCLGHSGPLTGNMSQPHDYPRQLIRTTLGDARSGKAPALSVSTCLIFLSPLKFLQTLWSELCVAASRGELETCRRVGTFVLTTPSTSRIPPLLPVFLHLLVPALITTFDAEQPLGPDQTVVLELLATLIMSALTFALHLEYGLRLQTHNGPVASGTLATARRLSADLKARRRESGPRLSAAAVLQRLTANQSFVANFPMFMGDV